MTDHLDVKDLLMYLDGELSKRRMRAVESHIRSCWTCASEVERLKRQIGVIVDAQEKLILPAVPAPPGPWRPLEVPTGFIPPPRHFLSGFHSPWRQFRAPLVLAVVVIVVAVSWLATPAASAREVLGRILESDGIRTTADRGRFVRQRVRVVRTRRATRQTSSEVIDAWRSASASYWQTADVGMAGSGLREYYRARNVAELPLSPAVYRTWSAETGGGGVVSRHGGRIRLSFDAADSGDLQRFRLWADPARWHVVRMDLGFRDDDFEIEEERLDVFPKHQVPQDVLAHLEPMPPIVERRPAVAVALPAAPVEAPAEPVPSIDKTTTELDVYFALHQAGADLGEPVEVTRLGSGLVAVRIWGVTADRRQFLTDLLSGMPGVEIEEGPAAAGTAADVLSAEPVLPLAQATMDDSSRADDQDRLERWFGSAEAEEAYTRSVLAGTTALLSHLYAWQELSRRWPPSEQVSLPESNRTKLAAMFSDHVQTAEQQCSNLQLLLKPLLDEFSQPGENGSSESQPAPDEDPGRATLQAAKSLDRLLRGLLTTSDSPVALDQAIPLIRERVAATCNGVQAMSRGGQ